MRESTCESTCGNPGRISKSTRPHGLAADGCDRTTNVFDPQFVVASPAPRQRRKTRSVIPARWTCTHSQTRPPAVGLPPRFADSIARDPLAWWSRAVRPRLRAASPSRRYGQAPRDDTQWRASVCYSAKSAKAAFATKHESRADVDEWRPHREHQAASLIREFGLSRSAWPWCPACSRIPPI